LDSEYTLAIMDGGNIANVSTVEVTIPPAPIQVPVSIRRTISVEWQANTNHLYEIQTSTDLKSWTATGEAFKPAQTNASASFYAEKPTQYFRVFDKTP